MPPLPGFRSRWITPWRVCGFKRTGHLDGALQQLIDWQSSLFEPVGKRPAFEVLHYQVVDAILMADITERADVRVAEARHAPSFGFKPLAG
jgi:hypothetical protein